MMRYLQRQKRLAILSDGFKRWCCLSVVFLFLLSVTLPLFTVFAMPPAYGTKIPASVQCSENTSLQMILAPSVQDAEQYVVLENDVLRGVRILQRVTFRFRYQQQVRLLVWYIMAGMLLLPVLLFTYYGDGKRRQQELIPRSLQIVYYRNRSDGKKEGIAFSIK